MARMVHFNNKNENTFCFEYLKRSGNTNSQQRKNVSKLMMNAIETDLTALQRYCLTEHCINGKKQKDIAADLGLSRSTVSRHITAGKKKLETAARHIGFFGSRR